MKACLPFVFFCYATLAGDFTSLCSDRAAIERVYYNHRLGQKLPFEQALPPVMLTNLVRQDLHKEAVLQQTYSLAITPALLATEVKRINTSTRASEMLAEIKTALANDPARFANSFAKPFLVESLLREKFNNDDALHAPQRRQAEQTRTELLAAKQQGADCEKLLTLLHHNHPHAVAETIWQLAARPVETAAPTADDPNAPPLSATHPGEKNAELYFQDLPADLQNVLRAQLRQAGDVSAVIETPGGYLLYVAKKKSSAVLVVAGLSLPKRDYEHWLTEQNNGKL